MTAEDVSAASGSDGPGTGPHALGHWRRHHRIAPRTQATDADIVAANARCFHQGNAEVATATATSTGKYAGSVAST